MIISIVSSISSFYIISVVVCEVESEGRPDPKIFIMYSVSAGDAAAVKSNEVKTLLATGWITFFYSKQFSFY